jgi:hypothetical protein
MPPDELASRVSALWTRQFRAGQHQTGAVPRPLRCGTHSRAEADQGDRSKRAVTPRLTRWPNSKAEAISKVGWSLWIEGAGEIRSDQEAVLPHSDSASPNSFFLSLLLDLKNHALIRVPIDHLILL